MLTIENKIYDGERALYALADARVSHVKFEGPADGESALKEGRRLEVSDCLFALRYPLWHDNDFTVARSEMTETARAALWYDRHGVIDGCTLGGIKALRECEDIALKNCKIRSMEFGWRCRGLTVTDTEVTTEYGFFECRDVKAERLDFHGKYSFQYTEGVTVNDSVFDTKDAFWHAKDCVLTDCDITGEYIGWYSENLTFLRCRIKGTQPFCYCKNLKLVDCEMVDADLAFEYSDVEADLRGTVVSVKNPKSGHIVADKIESVILGDAVYPCECEIEERK